MEYLCIGNINGYYWMYIHDNTHVGVNQTHMEKINGHKTACKRLYEYYKENGICVKCGRAWSLAGHALCGDCTKKAKRSQKKFDPNGSKKRERMAKIREERRLQNLCIDCGEKTDGIHRRCEKCLKIQRERTQLSNIRKRMKKGLI